MDTREPAGDGAQQARFSPELRSDIAEALGHRSIRRDAEPDEVLRVLANRVCAEAKALGMPPERMLIEVKRLFERQPLSEMQKLEPRRQLFDRFISGCIKAYFSADDMA